MTDSKPLHVRVAEALGWNKGKPMEASKSYPPNWFISGECGHTGYSGFVPRYDTDWSVAGPLIEKYGIYTGFGHIVGANFAWAKCKGEQADSQAGTLIAVCNLILALKAAGKLEP